MIIGLTGRNGAGKGEAAEFFKKGGFAYFSLSDAIRDEIRSSGKEVTRATLIVTGNQMRESGGPGVLAEKISLKLSGDQNYVIDSIRNPNEVKVFRRNPAFALIAIDAPSKVRFDRLVSRNREADPQSYEDFLKLEKAEESNQDSTAQQLGVTVDLADHTVMNDSDLPALHEKLREIVRDIGKKNSRPGWDEYFMGIAKQVSLRSNCIKRKVAAVIVKDQRIISTGYNGTPRGIKNCFDGGCPRCNSFGESGKGLDECLCSHAEENAIVQAAYHGVNLKESTIYTTFSPCLMCTKMIINSGIREVVYNVQYPMAEVPFQLLGEAYVKARKLGS